MMSPENKNIMYHAVLDILKIKYPEDEPQTNNKEAAKSIILAFEALEDIESQQKVIDDGNSAGETTETILSSVFKRVN